MPAIRHPEWRNSNEDTKYPFSQTATLVNDAGDVIFETTFLDASFYVVGADAELYLSKVKVAADTVTLYIGDKSDEEIASSTFNRATPPDVISFVDSNERPAGLIVSESIRLSIFSSWAIGIHEFAIEQTAFVARCCHAVPNVGLRGFELDDGSVVTGDVWLVGDDGVVLSCEDAEVGGGCTGDSQTVKVVRVDIVGDPLFRRKLCSQPGVFENPQFLQKLTFCSPSLLASSSFSSFESSDVSSSSSTVLADTDILFLMDTTGSMAATIAAVRDLFTPLVDQLALLFPEVTFKWAAAEYKDFADGDAYTDFGYMFTSFFTEDASLVQTGMSTWVAAGGGDTPECNMNALYGVARDWVDRLDGREDVNRIIVWCGDATSHVDTAAGYKSVAEAISMLQSKGCVVIACNTEPAGNGINTDGQATAIVDATEGVLVDQVGSKTVAELLDTLSDHIGEVIEGGRTVVVTRRRHVVVTDGEPGECVSCGPGEYGDVKLFVHSLAAPDTILRIRSVKEGLVIETVGERLRDIR